MLQTENFHQYIRQPWDAAAFPDRACLSRRILSQNSGLLCGNNTENSMPEDGYKKQPLVVSPSPPPPQVREAVLQVAVK